VGAGTVSFRALMNLYAVLRGIDGDITPAAITHAHTAGIPTDEPVRYPPGFLAYRLIVQLPAPRPFHKPASEPPAPLRTCDHCGRAYRAAQPGNCPCRARTAPVPPTAPDTAGGDYAPRVPLSEAAQRIKQRVERLAREAQQTTSAHQSSRNTGPTSDRS
jgi:hypothetical protein